MDETELRSEVGEAVLRFIAGVVLHNQEVAQRLGLGGSDGQFLGLMRVQGPLSPGTLAAQTGLSTGTVTGVIDRLERAGFVRRERDPGDRRKVVVSPVPEAMARMGEQYQEHGAHMDRVLRRRGPDELRVIADFLTEMAATPGGFVSPPPSSPTQPTSSQGSPTQ